MHVVVRLGELALHLLADVAQRGKRKRLAEVEFARLRVAQIAAPGAAPAAIHHVTARHRRVRYRGMASVCGVSGDVPRYAPWDWSVAVLGPLETAAQSVVYVRTRVFVEVVRHGAAARRRRGFARRSVGSRVRREQETPSPRFEPRRSDGRLRLGRSAAASDDPVEVLDVVHGRQVLHRALIDAFLKLLVVLFVGVLFGEVRRLGREAQRVH